MATAQERQKVVGGASGCQVRGVGQAGGSEQVTRKGKGPGS